MCVRLFVILNYWLLTLRELIFPRKCIVCDSLLDEDERFLCHDCQYDIPLTYFWIWNENPAKTRLKRFFPVDNAVSLFFYRHESGYAEILHKIKYEGNSRLGYEAGKKLGRIMAESRRFSDIQAIVPVPLHFLRKFKRGYNQAEIIAAGIASELGIPLMPKFLKRTRRTRTQVKLSVKTRYGNVANAFTVNKKELMKMKKNGISHILIFDDVITTGATISAAATPLINHFKITAGSLATVE